MRLFPVDVSARSPFEYDSFSSSREMTTWKNLQNVWYEAKDCSPEMFVKTEKNAHWKPLVYQKAFSCISMNNKTFTNVFLKWKERKEGESSYL